MYIFILCILSYYITTYQLIHSYSTSNEADKACKLISAYLHIHMYHHVQYIPTYTVYESSDHELK